MPEAPHPFSTQPVLEAYLEKYFHRVVTKLLRGMALKLAPTVKGTPDRLVLLPGGYSMLVELKTDRGQLDPAQRVWHGRAGQLGHHVYVLYGEAGIDHWVAEMQRLLDPSVRIAEGQLDDPKDANGRRVYNSPSRR